LDREVVQASESGVESQSEKTKIIFALLKDLPFSERILAMDKMNRSSSDVCKTRPSLLQRVQNTADDDSWDEFYQIYSGLVNRFALQRGLTMAEARDVVQETFIAVAKVIPQFHYEPALGSFRSWLLHTTQWRIYDQFHKRGQNGFAVSLDGTDPGSSGLMGTIPDQSMAQQEELWDREWRQNLIQEALQRLKPHLSAKQFQIFDLYVLQEWPVRKVARALNVSVTAVYLAKHRVGKQIKKEVEQLESQIT
jgi:RNA polymerase sigma factor (sigma-70 family)